MASVVHGRASWMDGLRGIGVLAVISWHVRDGAPFRALNGHNGVLVFFVVSGFLITGLALREEDREGRLDLRAFWRRRAWRLLPLYYLALAVVTVALLGLRLGDGQEAFRRALPYYAGYLQEWPALAQQARAPFALSWSLGIEEKFYVVWPLLAFLVLRRHRRWRVPLAAALLLASLASEPLLSRAWSAVLLPYSHILLGCLVALLLHPRPAGVPRAALWVPVTGTACLVLWFVPLEGAAQVLFTLPVAGLVAGLATAPTCAVARALAWRPLAWVGVVSYGVYLFHTLALNVVDQLAPVDLPPVALLLLGTALVLVVARVLHVVVEAPLIRYGRRPPRARRTAAGAVPRGGADAAHGTRGATASTGSGTAQPPGVRTRDL